MRGGGRGGSRAGGGAKEGTERERSEKEEVEERKVAARTGLTQRSTGESGVGFVGQSKRWAVV